ncbi:MAG: hypothetical protein Q9191_000625 [Dirinaria sp. TL-2023a]
MPHSPYNTTVYPPIRNFGDTKRDFGIHRGAFDNGDENEYREGELLDIGEALLDQCDFLEKKLNIKKREYNHLAEQYDELNEKNQALEGKIKAQELEIEALKRESGTKSATGVGGQLDSVRDGLGEEANSQDSNSEVHQTEKQEENNGSPDTATTTNPLKGGAATDSKADKKPVKKGRKKQGKKQK